MVKSHKSSITSKTPSSHKNWRFVLVSTPLPNNGFEFLRKFRMWPHLHFSAQYSAPEDGNLQSHHRENVKSYMLFSPSSLPLSTIQQVRNIKASYNNWNQFKLVEYINIKLHFLQFTYNKLYLHSDSIFKYSVMITSHSSHVPFICYFCIKSQYIGNTCYTCAIVLSNIMLQACLLIVKCVACFRLLSKLCLVPFPHYHSFIQALVWVMLWAVWALCLRWYADISAECSVCFLLCQVWRNSSSAAVQVCIRGKYTWW